MSITSDRSLASSWAVFVDVRLTTSREGAAPSFTLWDRVMDTTYVSEFNTASTKYTGPYAIVSWDGLRDSEGRMNGVGKIVFASGSTYEGSVRNDMMWGEGVLTDTLTNSVYSGSWVEDRREGIGKLKHQYGEYCGEYFNNKRHGQGKESDTEGVFEGIFNDGERVSGRMNYLSGAFYIGEMKDDLKHGVGKFIDEDGELFQGRFEDDEYKGPG